VNPARSQPDRLPLPPVSELTDAQADAVARISAGPRGRIVGPFVPLLRSPELMTRMQLVGEYLRFRSVLDDHLFELAILRVARFWNQQFEWGFHVPLALAAGLPQAVVDAIDRDEACTDAADDIQIADAVAAELLTTGSLTDALYGRAENALGEVKLVELLATIGYYTTLALVMNAARTPPPPDAPRLSPRRAVGL
jgi:4-carboxymuconolactone decarboxylase